MRFFLCLLLSVVPGLALAATCATGAAGVAPTATLTFTAPTTNTDGTPVATPLTYSVYQGAQGAETKAASGLSGSPITVNTGLTDGATVYFYVTVTDAKGVSSVPSNEVCKVFPVGVPGSVIITIT